VVYEDGTQGIADLKPLLEGEPYANVRENDVLFSHIQTDYGTLTWPDGTDIAPERVYEAVHAGQPITVPPQFADRVRQLLYY